jgi:hypothetical protein
MCASTSCSLRSRVLLIASRACSIFGATAGCADGCAAAAAIAGVGGRLAVLGRFASGGAPLSCTTGTLLQQTSARSWHACACTRRQSTITPQSCFLNFQMCMRCLLVLPSTSCCSCAPSQIVAAMRTHLALQVVLQAPQSPRSCGSLCSGT